MSLCCGGTAFSASICKLEPSDKENRIFEHATFSRDRRPTPEWATTALRVGSAASRRENTVYQGLHYLVPCTVAQCLFRLGAERE